ncbi:hypothetical protein AB0F20_10240 [Streptomyces goshikiensis]|uniref:hypothetical protein n=1 Tax=Streptomyces goshikiensis TaxID=1942 RepID=UPI0033F9487B
MNRTTYHSSADDHTLFSAEAYAAIEEAAERQPALYVPSVLQHAAELLTSLLAIGGRHHEPPAQWSWTGDMATGALDLAACPYERDLESDRTDAQVVSLTRFLHMALVLDSTQTGLTARLGAHRDCVIIDRGPATPRGGQHGDSALLVGIPNDGGWFLAFSDEHIRRVPIIAPASRAGAQEVAEVIRAFAHGELGEVFPTRRPRATAAPVRLTP